MGLISKGTRPLAVAAALSLVLVAALAAVAQAPGAAPSTDRRAAHGHHARGPIGDASPAWVVRDRAETRGKALPRLKGTVGPGRTITLSQDRVTAGRYRLVVTDESSQHNWHIRGTGVNERTSVSQFGKWVWRVRLRTGTYSVLCDPHPSSMKTTLRVTAN